MRTYTNYGDTPHVVRGVATDPKEIFYSKPEEAMTVPIQLMAGYGLLPVGTVIAKNLSAAGDADYFVPYNPTTFASTNIDHPGRAFLVADPSAGQAVVRVSVDDAYKFTVGDDLIINDNDTSAENLGAITDITVYSNYAEITATTNISGTFTCAQYAYVCIEAGDNTNNYSDAVGVLMKAIDTGTGVNAKGAMGQMIVGNAILVTTLLFLQDSAALTDLSVTEYGNYAYMK